MLDAAVRMRVVARDDLLLQARRETASRGSSSRIRAPVAASCATSSTSRPASSVRDALGEALVREESRYACAVVAKPPGTRDAERRELG